MKLLIVASIIASSEAHHLEHHQGQRYKTNIQASGSNKTGAPLPKCSQAICTQPTDPFRFTCYMKYRTETKLVVGMYCS